MDKKDRQEQREEYLELSREERFARARASHVVEARLAMRAAAFQFVGAGVGSRDDFVEWAGHAHDAMRAELDHALEHEMDDLKAQGGPQA